MVRKPENLKGIAERLRQMCSGHSFRQVGEITQINPESTRRYVQGLAWPSLPFIIKFAEEFDVSIEWLVLGETGVGSNPAAEEVIAQAEDELLIEEIARRLQEGRLARPIDEPGLHDQIITSQDQPQGKRPVPGRNANTKEYKGIGKDADPESIRAST